MKKVIIDNREVVVDDYQPIIRCPKCGRRLFMGFIKKAYRRLKASERQGNSYYVELGLKGMAKRWGKSVEHLRKMYLRRKKRLSEVNKAGV